MNINKVRPGEVLVKYFGKLGGGLFKNFSLVLEGMLACCSSNSEQIAIEMSKQNKQSLKTGQMRIYRLLSGKSSGKLKSKNVLHVSDFLWRMYMKFIFCLLKENKLIHHGKKIYIKVDFTSDRDDFLILYASIVVYGRCVPLYFSMRLYPRRKGMYNHKKMEKAFLKFLSYYLSKKYKYVIVADRGFGNQRFIDYCENFGFNYLVRLEPNMNIELANNQGIMSNIIKKNGIYKTKVYTWDKMIKIYVNSKNNSTWYLASDLNLKHIELVNAYSDSFKIENIFKNLKSAGFDIEILKIRKYDRFKRMLFLCSLTYALLVLTGAFIDKNMKHFKKKSPTITAIILASFQLENVHSVMTLKKL